MPAYALGWKEIKKRLVTRLTNLTRVGRVHSYVRWTRESPITEKWKSIFLDPNGKFNVWMLHREGLPFDATSPDNEQVTIRQHMVKLIGYMTHNDEQESADQWELLCDQIADDLGGGDLTLSQACLTFSLGQTAESGVVELFQGSILAHAVVIPITVEEVF